VHNIATQRPSPKQVDNPKFLSCPAASSPPYSLSWRLEAGAPRRRAAASRDAAPQGLHSRCCSPVTSDAVPPTRDAAPHLHLPVSPHLISSPLARRRRRTRQKQRHHSARRWRPLEEGFLLLERRARVGVGPRAWATFFRRRQLRWQRQVLVLWFISFSNHQADLATAYP
jgi:hypothetical protein